MKNALRSEFRKFKTLRSTFVILIIIFAILLLGAFYIEGLTKKGSAMDAHKLANSVLGATVPVAILSAIAVLLVMANEYRHNTITYTLTSIGSRSRVLLAKLAVSAGFLVIVSFAAVIVNILLVLLGLNIQDVNLPTQDFNAVTIFSHSIFYCLGFGLAGLLLITLLRNLAGAIVLLFFLPTTIEPLIGLILKNNSTYLPFNSLQQVLNQPLQNPSAVSFSPIKGAGIFCIYLVAGWLIAWYLFLRRDAN